MLTNTVHYFKSTYVTIDTRFVWSLLLVWNQKKTDILNIIRDKEKKQFWHSSNYLKYIFVFEQSGKQNENTNLIPVENLPGS